MQISVVYISSEMILNVETTLRKCFNKTKIISSGNYIDCHFVRKDTFNYIIIEHKYFAVMYIQSHVTVRSKL
jgi:hypothetical protein